jgi:hypothetical protein
MLKEMAVMTREEAVMICVDDKAIVPVGEPNCPISTGVRAHNKALVPSTATLSALDHDFHIHGAIPSVLFRVNIPESVNDSFYSGTVHVTVKDKVFTPSSSERHATENAAILRNFESNDGVELSKPRLYIFSDGGPDHRTTFWSVQLSHINTFVALDLDLLIAARTAPSQSYANPAERCMSLLNLALQNTSLQREKMDDSSELKVKSLMSLKKLREAADKQPLLKEALVGSLEPTIAQLKHRFSRLKLHGDHVVVHDAAAPADLEKFKEVLDIFKDDPDDPPIASCSKPTGRKLKDFIERHCRPRHYTYQVCEERKP